MQTTRRPEIRTAAVLWLCAAAQLALAAPSVSFTDTWKDTGEYNATAQSVKVVTTGSFSASISVPLGAVDLSLADAGTKFSFSIGPAGAPTQLVYDTLGNAAKYSLSKKTATFPLVDPYLYITNGSLTVTWAGTTITVTGSASGDDLDQEAVFYLQSTGYPGGNTFKTAADGDYYEVSLMFNAADNQGGAFYYDELVPISGSNSETEYAPPDGSGPYALESGSVTGTGDFTPPKIAIVGPAAYSKVYDTNPVVILSGQASDNVLVAAVDCVVNGNTNNPIPIDQTYLLPTNSIAWTASVDLSQFGVPGTNLITVMALDGSGNPASTARDFVWVSIRPPSLTLASLGGRAVVSWPASAIGWTLETNTSLTSGKWGAYAGAVVNNSVTNPASGRAVFFRLTQP